MFGIYRKKGIHDRCGKRIWYALQYFLYLLIKNNFTFYEDQIAQEISTQEISDGVKIEPPKYDFLISKLKPYLLADLLVEQQKEQIDHK